MKYLMPRTITMGAALLQTCDTVIFYQAIKAYLGEAINTWSILNDEFTGRPSTDTATGMNHVMPADVN